MTEEQYVKRVEEATDSYERTIQAIICLDSALRHDGKNYVPGSEFLPGLTMLAEPVPPDTRPHEVTPDLVLQMSADYGVVAEIKITASSQVDFHGAAEQLAAYDRDLSGWMTPTEAVTAYDLLILVTHSHSGAAVRYLDGDVLQHELVVVSLAHEPMRKFFICFERRQGHFSDQRIREKFDDANGVVAVSLEEFTPRFPNVKFYDARPEPVEYTMDVLWRELFPHATPTRQRQVGGRTVQQRLVNLDQARSELQRTYSLVPNPVPRQPEIPQKGWVREAMDAFVKVRRAERGDSEDDYWVQYSTRARNANLGGFARQIYRQSGLDKGILQMRL